MGGNLDLIDSGEIESCNKIVENGLYFVFLFEIFFSILLLIKKTLQIFITHCFLYVDFGVLTQKYFSISS